MLNINTIRMNPPMVLVKPYFDMGKKVYIDESINTEFNGAVSGMVIKVPDFLVYESWETDMELKEGDDVLFSWMASQECEEYNKIIYYQGEKYYIMPYEQIYCGRRDDILFGINGGMVLEEFKYDEDTGVLETPDSLKDRKHTKKAKVVALANPIKKYFHLSDIDESLVDVSVGDVVWMDNDSTADLEVYNRFFGGKTMFAQQRRYIQVNLGKNEI